MGQADEPTEGTAKLVLVIAGDCAFASGSGSGSGISVARQQIAARA